MNFDQSAGGVWLIQVMNNCLREVGHHQSQIDMNLLINMCRSEPKSAQIAMQILAQELRKELRGRPVKEATGMAQTWRLMNGSIFIAYGVAQGRTDRVPPELELTVKHNPEILDCFNFVMEDNRDAIEQLEADLDKPRKPWWKRW